MIKYIGLDELTDVNKLLQKLDKNEYVSVDLLNHPFFNYVGYIVNGQVVGVIKYSIIYERVEIDYIYVSNQHRKKGIGTELLKHVINESDTNGCVNINLEVRKNNVVARKLYESFGFKKILIRPNYYGDDDAVIYMRGEHNER